METELRPFRSRLNSFDLDMKCEIGEVSYQIGMLPTSRKNRIIEILKKWEVPFLEIGTGTNRFIIKYDGYAVKIALDEEGIADNKQEFVMSKMLSPNVTYSHEISSGGHMLVADYGPAFTSYSEMYSWSSTIRRILNDWSGKYLLGDVGLSRKNYANWGMFNGRPVCIDYAYIFPADMQLLRCHCGSYNIGPSDTTFTNYKCRVCGDVYEDRDIRMRISQEDRLKLFSDTEGFLLHEATEQIAVPKQYITLPTDPDYPDLNLVAQEVATRYPYIR